jgi:hypothetical protein
MLNPHRRTKFRGAHNAGGQAPFYYTPGPVFTEPAMAAIYHPTLQWPAQRILGGGYPIERMIKPIQPAPLFQPQMVTQSGIGIQSGQYALPPLSNFDGSWPDGVDVDPSQFDSASPVLSPFAAGMGGYGV